MFLIFLPIPENGLFFPLNIDPRFSFFPKSNFCKPVPPILPRLNMPPKIPPFEKPLPIFPNILPIPFPKLLCVNLYHWEPLPPRFIKSFRLVGSTADFWSLRFEVFGLVALFFFPENSLSHQGRSSLPLRFQYASAFFLSSLSCSFESFGFDDRELLLPLFTLPVFVRSLSL